MDAREKQMNLAKSDVVLPQQNSGHTMDRIMMLGDVYAFLA